MELANLTHLTQVINFYAGKNIDATEAFGNFHIRSKKAKKIMVCSTYLFVLLNVVLLNRKTDRRAPAATTTAAYGSPAS